MLAVLILKIAVLSALTVALTLGLVSRPIAAATEGTIAIELCGTLKEHRAATASGAGSVTIGTRTYAVAPGIQAGNGGVQVAVDRDLCIDGSAGRISNQLVRYLFFPLPPDGEFCGNVQHPLGGAPQATSGPLLINADFGALALTLGPGVSRPPPDARVCYAVEVSRPSGDLTALRSQPVDTTNEREWVWPCGTVKSYARATATSAGSITVGSRTYAIAPGTTYTGDPAGDRTDRIAVGSNMCVRATLGDTRAIIEYLTGPMTTQIGGAASEYTPPAGPSAGVIVLSFRSNSELRVSQAIADAVDLGRGSYCYSVGVDAFGDAIATALISCGSGGVAVGPPPTAGAPVGVAPPGPVHQCGTFVSYTPANATRSGQLIIGSTTYATTWVGSTGPAGSTPHPFNQVVASGVVPGSLACLDGTIANSQTEANLLTDFTVTPGPVPIASSAPTASPTPTLNPGFAHTDSSPPWIPLVVAGVLATLAAAVWLYRSRRARP